MDNLRQLQRRDAPLPVDTAAWKAAMKRRAQEVVSAMGLDPCFQILSAADVHPYVPVARIARFRHLLPPRAPRVMATIADWTALGIYLATGIVVLVLVTLHAFVKPMDPPARDMATVALCGVVVAAAMFQIAFRDMPSPEGDVVHVNVPRMVGMHALEVRGPKSVRIPRLVADVVLSSSPTFEAPLSQAFTVEICDVDATPAAVLSVANATVVCQNESFALRSDETVFLPGLLHKLFSAYFWEPFEESAAALTLLPLEGDDDDRSREEGNEAEADRS